MEELELIAVVIQVALVWVGRQSGVRGYGFDMSHG